MGRLALAALFALSLALAARAENARVWIFDDNPEAPSLGYGMPESDDVVIAFSCQPTARRMTIVEAIDAKKLNPGGAATFRLVAGGVSLDLTGDAIANESDGTVSIEVKGAPNPRLFALLKAGPALTIEVAGAKETIPLGAAAAHIPVFEKLCFGRR
jgi:hypothetical protein